jgi:vancomycin permeability regulator SanA
MLQILGLLFFFGFFVMLSVIRRIEGWKKALKILCFWIVSLGVIFMILDTIMGKESTLFSNIGLSLLGIWTIGLGTHCFKKGYIGKF